MERNHEDWLKAFVQYAGYGEAPKHIYWWVGVSAIAGALKRKAYIDQYYFRWFPNFYIVLVAKPGIISKSTAANIGMDLLKRVPGVAFGPNVVTWQALVQQLSRNQEEIEISPGHHETQSCLTINSSELGNFLNPQDREMIDLLVSTWDGADLRKVTKGSGNDEVPRPLINLISCTTPAWIASNIPEYMLGGGFLSRCIFVFAHSKEKFVAYPGLRVPKDIAAVADLLVEDLSKIASLSGEFALTEKAIEWGEEWYERLCMQMVMTDARVQDYVVRKQTHLHKLAMILSAARRTDMWITEKELEDADKELKTIENGMALVFANIGKTAESSASDEVLQFLKARNGGCLAEEVYKMLHSRFPRESDLDGIVRGLAKSGLLTMSQKGADLWFSVRK